MSNNMWDQRYATEDYAYGVEPNEFFKAFIDANPPGEILLPAEGEGRNAVYVAEKGWRVHALDFSREGRRKALKLAAERGVDITYEISDIYNMQLHREYDAIALIYVHMHKDHRRVVHRQLTEHLKPGGQLVLESFSKEQLAYGTGGPKTIDMLYDLTELKTDFNALQIITAETRIVDLDAGRSHKGKGSVIQLVATL